MSLRSPNHYDGNSDSILVQVYAKNNPDGLPPGGTVEQMALLDVADKALLVSRLGAVGITSNNVLYPRDLDSPAERVYGWEVVDAYEPRMAEPNWHEAQGL